MKLKLFHDAGSQTAILSGFDQAKYKQQTVFCNGEGSGCPRRCTLARFSPASCQTFIADFVACAKLLSMTSSKQRMAAKRNIKKAAAAAKRKQTIKHLPKKTRTALAKQAAKFRKRKSGLPIWKFPPVFTLVNPTCSRATIGAGEGTAI